MLNFARPKAHPSTPTTPHCPSSTPCGLPLPIWDPSREKIFGSLPKTDEIDARVMASIAYLHDVVGEEFTLKALRLPNPEQEELLT
jgi:hypothetical protein